MTELTHYPLQLFHPRGLCHLDWRLNIYQLVLHAQLVNDGFLGSGVDPAIVIGHIQLSVSRISLAPVLDLVRDSFEEDVLDSLIEGIYPGVEIGEALEIQVVGNHLQTRQDVSKGVEVVRALREVLDVPGHLFGDCNERYRLFLQDPHHICEFLEKRQRRISFLIRLSRT